jgi:hypothetical protein
MTMNNSSSSNDEPRVVRLRPRAGETSTVYQPPADVPIEDLSRYEDGRESAEEYRKRMIVNLAGLGFVVALIGAAIWLADTMATMRRNQDCVLSGRVGCTPVDYTPQSR